MAGSLNKVSLIGNLGADPEVRDMDSGDSVCNFSVATTETWKDAKGKKQEKTEWHRIVIFNQPLVEIAQEYLAKGSKVYLEGSLQTRKWTDKEDVERYSTEIVLGNFNSKLVLLGDAKGRKDEDEDEDEKPTRKKAAPVKKKPASRLRQSDPDDEIPF